MQIIDGVRYNLRGIKLGFKTPRLLLLGLLRFFVVIIAVIGLASIIIINQQAIISAIWTKPESLWIIWLWYIVSWLILIILIILTSVLSYLLSQILFSVVIMEMMSRITENIRNGCVSEQDYTSYFRQLIFLIKQEIPRAIIPVLILIILTIIGWLTPFGPLVTIFTSIITVAFLSWDNTDLAPARRFLPFNKRFGFFIRSFSFHLGFGILFLVPVFNILSLSFAPIGATMYFLDRAEQEQKTGS